MISITHRVNEYKNLRETFMLVIYSYFYKIKSLSTVLFHVK